ncbi:MAG: hypothetical protein AAF720_05300 [Pseudomonadota bacterium]
MLPKLDQRFSTLRLGFAGFQTDGVRHHDAPPPERLIPTDLTINSKEPFDLKRG